MAGNRVDGMISQRERNVRRVSAPADREATIAPAVFRCWRCQNPKVSQWRSRSAGCEQSGGRSRRDECSMQKLKKGEGVVVSSSVVRRCEW